MKSRKLTVSTKVSCVSDNLHDGRLAHHSCASDCCSALVLSSVSATVATYPAGQRIPARYLFMPRAFLVSLLRFRPAMRLMEALHASRRAHSYAFAAAPDRPREPTTHADIVPMPAAPDTAPPGKRTRRSLFAAPSSSHSESPAIRTQIFRVFRNARDLPGGVHLPASQRVLPPRYDFRYFYAPLCP